MAEMAWRESKADLGQFLREIREGVHLEQVARLSGKVKDSAGIHKVEFLF